METTQLFVAWSMFISLVLRPFHRQDLTMTVYFKWHVTAYETAETKRLLSYKFRLNSVAAKATIATTIPTPLQVPQQI